jgi:TonB family protein
MTTGKSVTLSSLPWRSAGGWLLLVMALAQCARQPVKPARRPEVVSKPPPVAVVEVKPPPPDRVVKVRGRRLVLKTGRLLSDVTVPPYRPEVPAPLMKEGSAHRGTYKVCVDARGGVRSVSTIKTAGNVTLDEAFRSAIQSWRYQPTRLGNKRVPFCYPLALKVSYPRAVVTAKRTGR